MGHSLCYLFGFFWFGLFALVPVAAGLFLLRALLDQGGRGYTPAWTPPAPPREEAR